MGMTFEQYQGPLHRILMHFCTRSIESENRLSEYLTKIVAEQLAASYQVLDGLSVTEAGTPVTITVPNFSVEEYQNHRDREYLAPLLEIYRIVREELAEFVDGFYIHGSLATLDYVKGWSDVDTLAILSKEAVTDSARLLRLREIFGKIHAAMRHIDPLQHHGVIVATAIDLKSYPEHILPLTVLARMKCMSETGMQVKLSVRALPAGFGHLKRLLEFIAEAGKAGVFEHHAYGDEYLLAEYKNADNAMYQFKYYVGQFLLIPSLYLTAVGNSVYKKESFELVREIFPKAVMAWIDLISAVRAKWGEKEGTAYVPNKIPEWVRAMIPTDYFKRGAEVAVSLLDHIEQMYGSQ